MSNGEGAAASKYHINQSPQNAIYCYSPYGPTFGGGHDLHICDNSNTASGSYTNTPSSYPAPTNTTLCGIYNGFTIDEIEVFAVQT
eukprot:TRINITY_DN6301_c0_g1_i1.p1 TRINITY_DN6301_c0_g1~~TRINITY_DN6301_c0_g1_i1.p1  ORF type:complete len:86 (-),score=6.78 TRINITY_DN6301_c0_g1_i1:169-426(-)